MPFVMNLTLPVQMRVRPHSDGTASYTARVTDGPKGLCETPFLAGSREEMSKTIRAEAARYGIPSTAKLTIEEVV